MITTIIVYIQMRPPNVTFLNACKMYGEPCMVSRLHPKSINSWWAIKSRSVSTRKSVWKDTCTCCLGPKKPLQLHRGYHEIHQHIDWRYLDPGCNIGHTGLGWINSENKIRQSNLFGLKIHSSSKAMQVLEYHWCVLPCKSLITFFGTFLVTLSVLLCRCRQSSAVTN